MSRRHRLAIDWAEGGALVAASFIALGPAATGHLTGASAWTHWILGAALGLVAAATMGAAEGGRTDWAWAAGLFQVAAAIALLVAAASWPAALLAYDLAMVPLMAGLGLFVLWAGLDARLRGALGGAPGWRGLPWARRVVD